ncbi:hypothetical protein, partial [Rhizobium leguminosarum]|uniref:hypothetical protein n=1 Tax=Rhizobium leguminosarum TaxID=384 RepID=UPI003F99EC7A
MRLLKDGTLDCMRGSRAEIPARTVVLEILAEIRPVDEQRRKQRHKQQYDDHSPQKDEETAYQCKASPFGILLPT